VRLTGGEPFVRKDFAEIAALTERLLQPALLHITSNGFLTERIVSYCEQRARTTPLQLLISSDGVGAKHDEIRGRRDAFALSMATVRALAPRQRELGLRLAVNQTVVDTESARQYGELRDLLRPLGVRNQVVVAYQASATYSLGKETSVAPVSAASFPTFTDLPRAELEALFAEIERDLGDFPLPEQMAKRYYLEGIRQRLLEGRGTLRPPCVALGAHLRLYPNGDVPTCQFNSKRVGNLATQPFEALWSGTCTSTGNDATVDGTTIGAQRRWVRDCPGCWAECEVLPSALYSADLLRFAGRKRR
jgi:MoaA/NifB/PqqE/SkfB family radical SAM enzyme